MFRDGEKSWRLQPQRHQRNSTFPGLRARKSWRFATYGWIEDDDSSHQLTIVLDSEAVSRKCKADEGMMGMKGWSASYVLFWREGIEWRLFRIWWDVWLATGGQKWRERCECWSSADTARELNVVCFWSGALHAVAAMLLRRILEHGPWVAGSRLWTSLQAMIGKRVGCDIIVKPISACCLFISRHPYSMLIPKVVLSTALFHTEPAESVAHPCSTPGNAATFHAPIPILALRKKWCNESQLHRSPKRAPARSDWNHPILQKKWGKRTLVRLTSLIDSASLHRRLLEGFTLPTHVHRDSTTYNSLFKVVRPDPAWSRTPLIEL
jgi:hypothetical protein